MMESNKSFEKSSDKSFAKSEHNLLKVMDKNADSIVVVNDVGHLLYLNSAAKELFDRIERLRVGALFGFPLAAGETTELDILRKSGKRVVVEMRVVDIDWNRQAASLASMRDVTQRKITEELLEIKVRERTADLENLNAELKRLYEAANEATEVRTQFIANVSHEVRTPLAGIVTSAELLQLCEGPELKELAGIVLGSSKQLMQLVETILDFSKLEAGRVSVMKAPFEIKELTEFVIESVYSSAKLKGIALTTEYAPEFPDVVSGDAGKVRQVLMNLVSNAIKFTSQGSVHVSLSVEDERGVSLVKICVKDTGIGMTPGECNTIFQPFVQANHSIQSNYGGTGLGLAICKGLAAAMGGDIGFCSEPSKGSSFWFTFPIENC